MSAKPLSFSWPSGRIVWPFKVYFAGWAAGRLGVMTVFGASSARPATRNPCASSTPGPSVTTSPTSPTSPSETCSYRYVDVGARALGANEDETKEEGEEVTVMSPRRIAVCFEVTPKQTFASALDWPGWCRAGRDEGAALELLASYAERYTPVAEQAGLSFPSTVAFDVVERVPGGPATAFAAPECRRPFPQVTRSEEARGGE